MKFIKREDKDLSELMNSPCPRHGFEYPRILTDEKVPLVVCWAETPKEISKHCWYHLTVYSVKDNYVCKICGKPRWKGYSYCFECRRLVLKKAKKKWIEKNGNYKTNPKGRTAA